MKKILVSILIGFVSYTCVWAGSIEKQIVGRWKRESKASLSYMVFNKNGSVEYNVFKKKQFKTFQESGKWKYGFNGKEHFISLYLQNKKDPTIKTYMFYRIDILKKGNGETMNIAPMVFYMSSAKDEEMNLPVGKFSLGYEKEEL